MKATIRPPLCLICLLASLAMPATSWADFGLTKGEAFEAAEQVVRGFWPGAWRQNEKNLHCRRGKKRVACSPLIFSKRLGPQEIELLFSLIKNLHPYKEIFGQVTIHADPNGGTQFLYRVERCRSEPVAKAGCWLVGATY